MNQIRRSNAASGAAATVVYQDSPVHRVLFPPGSIRPPCDSQFRMWGPTFDQARLRALPDFCLAPLPTSGLLLLIGRKYSNGIYDRTTHGHRRSLRGFDPQHTVATGRSGWLWTTSTCSGGSIHGAELLCSWTSALECVNPNSLCVRHAPTESGYSRGSMETTSGVGRRLSQPTPAPSSMDMASDEKLARVSGPGCRMAGQLDANIKRSRKLPPSFHYIGTA